MNKARLSKIQLDLLSNLEPSSMGIRDLLRYGKSLLFIHKKSRQILRNIEKDHLEQRVHWEIIKGRTDTALEDVVVALEIFSFDLEKFGMSEMISTLNLVSAIKAMSFEEDKLDRQYGEKTPDEVDITRNLRALVRLEEEGSF